jgi:hypothetical protein
MLSALQFQVPAIIYVIFAQNKKKSISWSTLPKRSICTLPIYFAFVNRVFAIKKYIATGNGGGNFAHKYSLGYLFDEILFCQEMWTVLVSYFCFHIILNMCAVKIYGLSFKINWLIYHLSAFHECRVYFNPWILILIWF